MLLTTFKLKWCMSQLPTWHTPTCSSILDSFFCLLIAYWLLKFSFLLKLWPFYVGNPALLNCLLVKSHETRVRVELGADTFCKTRIMEIFNNSIGIFCVCHSSVLKVTRSIHRAPHSCPCISHVLMQWGSVPDKLYDKNIYTFKCNVL